MARFAPIVIRRNEIVRAHWSQVDARYGSTAGIQCVAMCLAYAMYNCTSDRTTMTPRDLNKILDIGDGMYHGISNEVGQDLLLPSEIPSDIVWRDVRYDIQLGIERVGTIHAGHHAIMAALTNVFSVYGHTFFICRSSCILLKSRAGRYYLFDSHSRSSQGYVEPNGKACSILFPDFYSMVRHITILFAGESNAQYEITPFQIVPTAGATPYRMVPSMTFARGPLPPAPRQGPNIDIGHRVFRTFHPSNDPSTREE